MPASVLVVEPKKREDPEIEQALSGPGVDVRYASGIDEALKLTLALLPAVIILDALVPGLDTWRLIARIWEEAKKRSHRPVFILLSDKAARWEVDHFGPVRFSDRRHLREAFQDILASPRHGIAPNLPEETAWETVRDSMWARGNERFRAQQARLHALGLVDERGRPTSKDWPADMRPGSKTDIAT